ncbi:hypothetical protein HNR15_000561 [Allobranchiibius huperziae]|uniref:Uncharacterized protein n=1 Tax=Allobranchiibius huperziae TaxID=1874116 RepID=A0A853D9F9_9MICO|nr:hypothetical protein [Allobranchiibius huperziae]
MQLTNVQAEDVSIATAQHTDIYPPPPGREGTTQH